MQKNLKVSVHIALITSLVVLTTAQNANRSQRKGFSNRSQHEPKEQGRTLGLIRPLLGLGLNAIAGPLVGYDVPLASAAVNRPSSSSRPSQSDPYYGYGSYGGGYAPNFYSSYNYYGGYPLYRPSLYRPAFRYYNGYRPQVYPGYYSGYAQNNVIGSQRPVYSNSRPSFSPQRPLTAQQPAAYPTLSPVTTASSGTTSAQSAQIANLLGQLLGQQLRPLLNPGATSPAHDEPGITPVNYQNTSFESRYYRG